MLTFPPIHTPSLSGIRRLSLWEVRQFRTHLENKIPSMWPDAGTNQSRLSKPGLCFPGCAKPSHSAAQWPSLLITVSLLYRKPLGSKHAQAESTDRSPSMMIQNPFLPQLQDIRPCSSYFPHYSISIISCRSSTSPPPYLIPVYHVSSLSSFLAVMPSLQCPPPVQNF